jgi:hypothetical protein
MTGAARGADYLAPIPTNQSLNLNRNATHLNSQRAAGDHLQANNRSQPMLNRIQQILNLESLRGHITSPLDTRDILAGETQLNEQTKKIIEIPNGKAVRSLDYSEDLNDPQVYISGYGPWRLSYLKKDIQKDLNSLAQMVGTRPASQLLQIMSDVEGKKSSNLYVAFKLLALAEVEEFLSKPTTKRRLTQMKTK